MQVLPDHQSFIDHRTAQHLHLLESIRRNLEAQLDYQEHSHDRNLTKLENQYQSFIEINLVEDPDQETRKHFQHLGQLLKRPDPIFPITRWSRRIELRIPNQKRFQPILIPLIVAGTKVDMTLTRWAQTEGSVLYDFNKSSYSFCVTVPEIYDNWKNALRTNPEMRKALKLDH